MTKEALKIATRDGVTLHYVDVGAGDPPLLFVHGWTCNHTNWRKLLPLYATRHRVVALDQRGHGESDKPDQDYTIGGFVNDLAWLISELGLERPVVIGHSMGGEIALNLAHQHSGRVRGIVMIDSPIVPLPEAMKPLAEAAVTAMKLENYRATAEAFARTQFFNADTAPELIEELIPSMMETPQRLMYSAIESILDPANMPAGEVPVPALLIRASTAFASEEQFRGRYPGMEIHTVDCAHFIQMEKPAEASALIDAFLEKLR